MTTELCSKCKRSHAARPCDKTDGVETADLSEAAKEANRKDKSDTE
ncbi:MAG: hypothetical protein WA609_01145 [Terriglobales bacterium]